MNGIVSMEPVPCPLCGSLESATVFCGPDRAHAVPGTFCVVRCRSCATCYQNPRPTAESFDAIYPSDYEPYQSTAVTAGNIHPDLAMACAFIAQRQPHGGQLLDIGCGPGRFLQAMRLIHPQWSLAGIEPDSRAAAQGQAAGLTIYQSTFEDANLPATQWDAITLWNVLEHLPDPRGMLQRIGELLRPGGMIYLAVPLCDSWDACLFGQYWTGWELPRHFTHFDRRSLAQILAAAGLTVRREVCINGRSYGFTASLRLLLESQLLHSFALRRLGQALTYSRPLALAISPYTRLAVAARRCTVLTIAASRTDS